ERLADISPFAVVRLIDDLGYRAWGLALAASVLGVLHLLGIHHGLARLTEDPLPASALLTASWISGLYWATFFMRLLGVWSFWSRSEKAITDRSSQPPASG